MPVFAASPPPGLVIQNKATGSYINTDNAETSVESNIVQVTVAEVAGITVTAQGTNGSPATGNTTYFYFQIANVGNDPTQFFLPDAPSNITGGTAGPIQLISYDPDGSGTATSVDLSSPSQNKIVPSGGATTTTILTGVAGTNDGSIPPGGTITVRIPVTVTATNGQTVSVTLGDTTGSAQNVPYIAGTKDLYTVDNPDGVAGEAAGTPLNGDATQHRQEASAAVSITATNPVTPIPPTGGSICAANGGTLIGYNRITGGSFPYVGSISTNIPGASTSYSYQSNGTWLNGWPNDGNFTPNDGQYVIAQRTGPIHYGSNGGFGVNGVWVDTTDHTGSSSSSFMVINADTDNTKNILDLTVTGLTIGQSYEFSSWATNLFRQDIGSGSILPNFAFEYSTDNGTTWQQIVTTGNIPLGANNQADWKQYGGFIRATQSSIRIRLRSNALGGNGNDFAVDDITLQGCNLPPNVLLVKRITAVNGAVTNGGVPLNTYDPDPANPYDKNVIQVGLTPPSSDRWPNTTGATSSTFLLGARDGGNTKITDEVEYTIYFLSAGPGIAKGTKICDRIPVHQTFVPDAFNSLTAAPNTTPASPPGDRGIMVSQGTIAYAYTNIGDGDTARYYPPGSTLPSACTQPAQAEDNGTVVVELGDLPNATASGVPAASYGFFRFRAKVK